MVLCGFWVYIIKRIASTWLTFLDGSLTFGDARGHGLRTLKQPLERLMWGGTGTSHQHPAPTCQPCQCTILKAEYPSFRWATAIQLGCCQIPDPWKLWQTTSVYYYLKSLNFGGWFFIHCEIMNTVLINWPLDCIIIFCMNSPKSEFMCNWVFLKRRMFE